MKRQSSLVLSGVACVLVSLPGCSDHRERHTAVSAPSTTTGATLSGRVVNFQNKTRGVGGALVRGRNEPVSVFSARTAADGRFQVTVPEGTHVVTAQGGGCRNMNRGVNISFSTDVRVVVANGQVVSGAQPEGADTAQLPVMYMDCRILPVVTITNGSFSSAGMTAHRTGSLDQALTVYFDVTADPGLLGCRVNGDSFTFPPGSSFVFITPVIPKAGPSRVNYTATLRANDEYEVGSPGSATKIGLDCG